MKFDCKLVKKTFAAENGEVRAYYVLEFPIVDNEKMEITIKKDKAQLLMLSKKAINLPDTDFWADEETDSLN